MVRNSIKNDCFDWLASAIQYTWMKEKYKPPIRYKQKPGKSGEFQDKPTIDNVEEFLKDGTKTEADWAKVLDEKRKADMAEFEGSTDAAHIHAWAERLRAKARANGKEIPDGFSQIGR